MPRYVVCLIAVVLPVFVIVGFIDHGSAQDLASIPGDLQAFFSEHFGDNDIEYFDMIWSTITTHYPELTELSQSELSGIYFDSFYGVGYYADSYVIKFTILHLSESETHLFVRIEGRGETIWRIRREEHVRYGIINMFLRWNDHAKQFEALDVQGGIPLHDNVSVEVLHLGNDVVAVYILGSSGAGLIGEFSVYRYTQDMGYECVWHIDEPYVEVTKSPTSARVTVTMLDAWNDFPISDLRNLDNASILSLLRRYEVEYSWDDSACTFVETSKREVFHELAVVNHFLKALKEQRFEKAKEYLDESIGVQPEILLSVFGSFLTGHMVIPYLYQSDEWADLAGYEPRLSGRLLTVLGISRPDEIGWLIDHDLIESIAVFEFAEGETLKILHIHIHDPRILTDN